MSLLLACLNLFYVFLKIGLFGFGGGYAMISMIMAESEKLAITVEEFADLNALDMIIPGPIAINAATYVGYLNSGVWGSLLATIGVSVPSLVIVSLVMRFIDKYKQNTVMEGVLSGVKPAAVGFIAAAAITIANGIIIKPGMGLDTLLSDPLGTVSVFMLIVFFVTAFVNIRFKVNPILLTALAGVAGAFFIR